MSNKVLEKSKKVYASILLKQKRRDFKNFITLEELNEKFDDHVIEKLIANDFICVTILLLQDFKDVIELFKGSEIKNDQEVICFIRSAYELNILDYKYYKVFQDFNTLRNTMAHEILKQIRKNTKYYANSKRTWKEKIERFVKNKHNIYRCLLINLLEKGKKISNKDLHKLWRIVFDIIIKEKPGEIKRIKDKYKDKNRRYDKVESFIMEEAVKFIEFYSKNIYYENK